MRSAPAGPRSLLQHGVDASNELVAIDAVPRGRGSLACPYCATDLIAKKGLVLVPHFAHDGPTCRESSESSAARIPLYDDFATLEPLARADLRLSAQLLRRTINHTSLRGWRRAALGRLLEAAARSNRTVTLPDFDSRTLAFVTTTDTIPGSTAGRPPTHR